MRARPSQLANLYTGSPIFFLPALVLDTVLQQNILTTPATPIHVLVLTFGPRALLKNPGTPEVVARRKPRTCRTHDAHLVLPRKQTWQSSPTSTKKLHHLNGCSTENKTLHPFRLHPVQIGGWYAAREPALMQAEHQQADNMAAQRPFNMHGQPAQSPFTETGTP